jgi:hypothetical protein
MKFGIEGPFLNIINIIYDKPIANITLNRELKPFPVNPRLRQGCQLTPLLFNIVVRFPTRAIRQKKKKGYK